MTSRSPKATTPPACKSKSANQPGAKVRYNIALEVGQDDDIEKVWPCDQLHTKIIHDNIICLEFRIFPGDFIKAFE